MDVINKLYSSVSSTVSQLSGVLPGNPVTREFEATDHIASAGPGLQWKIYRGYKKSTKQEAAIFVFEKRQLDKWSRDDRDQFLETLKRGVVQLTKLRHPHVLTVQHGLEESRESLAFATEPVFASLANILGNKTNMPQPIPPGIASYKLFEIEIKYGLQQLCEGLAFLHTDCKLIHRNVNPESVIVNQSGAWKLFGFEHCLIATNNNQNQNQQNKSVTQNGGVDLTARWPFKEYNPTWHPLNQPRLDYMGPEYVLTERFTEMLDVYSLGVLVYGLYDSKRNDSNCGGQKCSLKNYEDFKRKWKSGKNKDARFTDYDLSCVKDDLRDYVKLMLNQVPEMRPELHEFLKVSYFEDVGVKTLSYLDSLFQWDNLQKSKFYKGLPQVIRTLPHRIKLYRILPCLVKEFVNPPMVPFVLPNVLLIAESCTGPDEYRRLVLPHLKPVMRMQDPVQILLIFMQRMELLLKLTPAEDVKNDVLPMLYRALESDAQQIQELCLSVLPTFASLIDYAATKNSLLPRIKRLCLSTQLLSVRVNCLLCLGKLLEHLDKWLVLDEVLPFVQDIKSREPAVLMGILGIYKLALTHPRLGITKEVLATRVIPFLVPLCIENGLTLNQFNALVSVVRDMFGRVEQEHRGKLEQLNGITDGTRDTDRSFDMAMASLANNSDTRDSNLMPDAASKTRPATHRPQTETELMFSGLGLEDYLTGSGGNSNSNSKPIQQQNNNSDNATTAGIMSTSGGAGSNQSLSLEDKQRIMRQQESVQKLRQQPDLISASNSTTRPNNTISSIGGNINSNTTKPNYNLDTTTAASDWTSNTSNNRMTMTTTDNISRIQNSNSVPTMMTTMQGNNFLASQQQHLKFSNTNQQFSNSTPTSFINNATNTTVMNQFIGGSNTNRQNNLPNNNFPNPSVTQNMNSMQQNLSGFSNFNATNSSSNNSTALDGLLSLNGQQNRNKVPMNQMSSNTTMNNFMLGSQPLLATSSNNSGLASDNRNVKNLTKEDIFDLLS